MIGWVKKYLLHIAWLQAFAATVASLFVSEVIKLPVCSLCWYQRIFMYPLVLIIAIGILKKDNFLPTYVLPLSVAGMFTALYQYLLQMQIIPPAWVPCSTGVPCDTKDIDLFGFITLPLLSLMAFLVITVCMIIFQSKQSAPHD